MLDLFPMSDRARDLHQRVSRFQRETIEPAEAEYFAHVEHPRQRWTIPPVVERLKVQAKAAGLWNLFLPGSSQASMTSRRPLSTVHGLRGTRAPAQRLVQPRLRTAR